mgnify:CR=1 FL=1
MCKVRIIKKYVDKDERIVLLKNQVNSGLAATLNKCIEASHGEYIARMDDDDISHPDRLAMQENFGHSSEYSIVGSCRRTFDNDGVWNTYGTEGRINS